MAHQNKVMQSINAPDGSLCVDVFLRPDDTFGFDEFRRDPEDPRGWYSIGHYGAEVFDTQHDARAHAELTVAWLAELSGEIGI